MEGIINDSHLPQLILENEIKYPGPTTLLLTKQEN